ncbi:hypothetical protein QAD02_024182 [Eretmocerus hayati]|uniref:Uncharacterized protein n=1 Tax=Eretmocerus hayati TaxID=131215 RepID=A0ACC2PY39_9HYME|nr:hypothetical protein QAD02_024182 [Eretmocerus hayati]
MSQPSVTDYFATRKRRASGELQNKHKVLALGEPGSREALPIIREKSSAPKSDSSKTKTGSGRKSVARNLKFGSNTKPTQSIGAKAEEKNVVFAKLGNLSPQKQPASAESPQKTPTKELVCFKTPTKESRTRDLSLNEIKSRVNKSSRLKELRARIDKFKKLDEKLEDLERNDCKSEDVGKVEGEVRIKEFNHIELEIPASPCKTPSKLFSPTKALLLSPKASPAKRLLFEPKEIPASPVKSSPVKAPAYQRYQALSESETRLPLPYKYRFLAEVFRSVDTVSAMLHNRKETITFSKLKPAVQELVRRNFTLDHLAQIKTVYPDAFSFCQEKFRNFGVAKSESYELVITPIIQKDEAKSGRNTPDEDDVLKSAQQMHMSPGVLLERRKKFTNKLVDLAKDEHEQFLQSLEKPMKIDKDKVTRWHPEFDVDSCKDIEKAELPQPPVQEKLSSATDVLHRAHRLFNDNSRMKRALEKLTANQIQNSASESTEALKVPDELRSVNSSIVDTPPATPKTPRVETNSLLKGVPPALLEKIRAKQAAKALEMMTRSSDADKDAIRYARLPEMAKILRNIFVSEKKGVLNLEFVVKKLDDSYRTKLSSSDLEEHIKLICKLLPLWATIHVVRKVDYLKIVKDMDMAKVIKRLEVLADEKA